MVPRALTSITVYVSVLNTFATLSISEPQSLF